MVRHNYDGLPVYRIKLIGEDYQAEYANFSHPEVERHFVTVLDELRPDVVHGHNLIGLSLGILRIAKSRGVRTVITLHDHWGFCYKNTIIKRPGAICRDFARCAECMAYVPNSGNGFPIQARRNYFSLLMNEVDAFISPSQYLADKYVEAGFPAARMHVIWNGVDVDRFSKVRKTPPGKQTRFTFIGHLGAHKGIGTLLDAVSLVRHEKGISVNVVGGGELMPDLQNRAARLGIGEIVHFWGKLENRGIDEVFAQTDVQILPSIWPENQPVSITEAMASRTPVIASRIGGIPELIDDGKSGLLFEPGNAAQLAECMRLFMAHPERIEAFGREGFRKIESKSLDNQVRAIQGVYQTPHVETTERNQPTYLVLCAGDNFDPDCSNTVAGIWNNSRDRAVFRFIKTDWVSPDRFLEAKLLWIVGSGYSSCDIRKALEAGVPLLVPEANAQLLALCRASQCGLYYRNAADAGESLRFLFGNPLIAAALGRRAKTARFMA